MVKSVKNKTVLIIAIIMHIMYVHNSSYAQSLKVGEPQAINIDIINAQRPKWSPSGKQIAFSTPGNDQVYILDTQTKTASLLAQRTGIGFGFQWSPDGEFILARETMVENKRSKHAVVLVNVAEKSTKQLTNFESKIPDLPIFVGSDVRFTENKNYVTLQKAIPAPSNELVTKVLNYENKELKLYSLNGVEIIRPPFEQPLLNEVLSPDAKYAAFEVYGGNLYVMNLETQELTDLGTGNRPSFSPDGKFIVYMQADDNGHSYTRSDIMVKSIDGSKSFNLTGNFSPLAMNPSWSPNGKEIVFDSPTEGKLFLIAVETITE
ncbi:hypothetical protein EP331_12870 [bacterium]|nr:MAG: hypothetical protein EP331_12870 [bacterium]